VEQENLDVLKMCTSILEKAVDEWRRLALTNSPTSCPFMYACHTSRLGLGYLQFYAIVVEREKCSESKFFMRVWPLRNYEVKNGRASVERGLSPVFFRSLGHDRCVCVWSILDEPVSSGLNSTNRTEPQFV
jgi:hypothetical protein